MSRVVDNQIYEHGDKLLSKTPCNKAIVGVGVYA
jgi:hypothetical protein